jgi:uncharacterized membrane protein
MAQPIGNPLSWSVDAARATSKHLGAVLDKVSERDESIAHLPEVRRLTIVDLRQALQKGVEDFVACRTDVMFLCLLYPVIGIFLTWLALDRDLLPLLFPAISGFALLGPVAGIGLYEMSRRREQGLDTNWITAFSVISSPSFGAILVLGLFLLGVFTAWLFTAGGLYAFFLGSEPPQSATAFLHEVLTTGPGWGLIVVGMAVGFLFAIFVLTISLVSFPLLLDRDVGIPVAVATSMRVAAFNPGPVAAWGLFVAVSLALGSLPFFLGLIVVLPILGHATWHVYRAAVTPPQRLDTYRDV